MVRCERPGVFFCPWVNGQKRWVPGGHFLNSIHWGNVHHVEQVIGFTPATSVAWGFISGRRGPTLWTPQFILAMPRRLFASRTSLHLVVKVRGLPAVSISLDANGIRRFLCTWRNRKLGDKE